MEKFQRSSALLNIKYYFVVLFLSQLYLLFIYNSKYIFSQITIVKPSESFVNFLQQGEEQSWIY